MELKELGKSIADIGLKVLGTAVAGPAGEGVADMISRALGLDSSAPDRIAEVIRVDPAAALKLKELEMQHSLELEKLNLEAERLRLADVASARAREVEVTKATGKRDYSMEVLGWVIVLGFFATVAVRMFVEVNPSQLENLGLLLGAEITAFITVVTYKYGSSKGSADKTALLAVTMDRGQLNRSGERPRAPVVE